MKTSKVTFADIAEYTGFSKTTISRYFNNPDSLTLENQSKIAEALEVLDYKENNNGLTLDGETADGKASSIVFYSETAIEKFADITGRGEKHNHSCGEYGTT